MHALVYIFVWSMLLWFLLDCESLCACVPCLMYPQRGDKPQVYYFIPDSVTAMAALDQDDDDNDIVTSSRKRARTQISEEPPSERGESGAALTWKRGL